MTWFLVASMEISFPHVMSSCTGSGRRERRKEERKELGLFVLSGRFELLVGNHAEVFERPGGIGGWYQGFALQPWRAVFVGVEFLDALSRHCQALDSTGTKDYCTQGGLL